MKKVTISDARQNWADTIYKAAYGGRRILICRHKRAIAALVSVADAERLEAESRGRKSRRTPLARQ